MKTILKLSRPLASWRRMGDAASTASMHNAERAQRTDRIRLYMKNGLTAYPSAMWFPG